jgi:acyl-coenzyme A synthetase/AMP-(fatty) acid ligase
VSDTYVDFSRLLAEHARRRPDRVAIESPDQGSRITYGELDRVTTQLAHFLAASGVAPGDRVSLLADNSLEALLIFWAALRSGAVINPINVEIREKHIQQILHEVRPRLVFWSRDLPDPLKAPAAGDTPPIGFGDRRPGPRAPDDLWARVDAMPATPLDRTPAPTDLSVIDYTSGTTDTPKGVVWTHAQYYAMSESSVDRLEMTAADTILDYRHFSWSSPQILSIGPSLLTGATLVFARKFSQARFFDWIRACGVTIAIGIPTVINMLLNRPVAVTKGDLPTLRFMTSSTAPLSVERHLEFERVYGFPIVQLAGGTETGFMCGNSPRGRKLGSIGRPTLNMIVRILDEDGNECPVGQEGEMVVSGRQLALGYLVGPDEIRPIPPEGHRTGDMAVRDAEGYVTITGRKKDIIIKGGVNIAALEITNALLQHPAVAEAATIGVPDPIYGEVPAGFVVPRAGQTLTEAQLGAHCRASLSDFKVPAAIVVLDAIPKNANGKVAKEELRPLWDARVGR